MGEDENGDDDNNENDDQPYDDATITPLSYLYTMMDAWFLTKPATFVNLPTTTTTTIIISSSSGSRGSRSSRGSRGRGRKNSATEMYRLTLGYNDITTPSATIVFNINNVHHNRSVLLQSPSSSDTTDGGRFGGEG